MANPTPYTMPMLYPVRITPNGKGGLRFTMPKLIKTQKGWEHEDIYIAYPRDELRLVVQHFKQYNDEAIVKVPKHYEPLVYSLYVIKGKEQMDFELPVKITNYFNWLKERMLVVVDEELDYVVLRKITQL